MRFGMRTFALLVAAIRLSPMTSFADHPPNKFPGKFPMAAGTAGYSFPTPFRGPSPADFDGHINVHYSGCTQSRGRATASTRKVTVTGWVKFTAADVTYRLDGTMVKTLPCELPVNTSLPLVFIGSATFYDRKPNGSTVASGSVDIRFEVLHISDNRSGYQVDENGFVEVNSQLRATVAFIDEQGEIINEKIGGSLSEVNREGGREPGRGEDF